MLIAATAQSSSVYLAVILLIALIAFRLWRSNRRRGQVVSGAEIAPAVDAVIQRILAGDVHYVVLSVNPRAYVQFATEPNGAILAEANCPADSQAAVKALVAAGLSEVQGPPNYRASFSSTDVGRLAGLARDYIDALGAQSLTIQAWR